MTSRLAAVPLGTLRVIKKVNRAGWSEVRRLGGLGAGGGSCGGLEACGTGLGSKLRELGRLCRSRGKQSDLVLGGSFGYAEMEVQAGVGDLGVDVV